MVGPMLVLRLFRSKLRKREDHATPATPAADVVLHNVTSQTTPPTATTTAVCTISTTSLTTATPASTAPTEEVQPTLGLWQYPPQYTMYSTDKDTLVHPIPVERPKFCRGIRKNLSGRWKRLTKKKPADEPYKIPADLRDQLKSIYVY